MIEYLVIGLCLLLLVLVVFISARPISMGIEARRNINHNNTSDNIENDQEINDLIISDEIIKLNKLKDEGILTEQEYEKAKKKLLD
tara:strand:+ start:192 stop:449 length:258 start_codon:yes stop_codon:yes gene_type:complete